MSVDHGELSEARFTAPSPWCPNPGYWSSTDDHSTEIEISELLAGIVRGLQPELCVETGSAFGQTAQAIGEALAANRHGHLISLEVDEERVEISRQRCEGLPVEILALPSLDFRPSSPVDFAFFDSLFPLRVREFHAYQPWMHPGTFVAFHDSAPYHGGGQLPFGWDLKTQLDAELGGDVALMHFRTPRGITIGTVK